MMKPHLNKPSSRFSAYGKPSLTTSFTVPHIFPVWPNPRTPLHSPAQWITSVLSPKIKSTFSMRMVWWPSNQQRGLNVSQHFSIVLKLTWAPSEDDWRCCRWLLKLNAWINFNGNGVKKSGVGQQSLKNCFQIKLPWSDPTAPILGRITNQLDKRSPNRRGQMKHHVKDEVR